MLGNVFSPYYARKRRLGPADPFDHCTINVAYYGHELSFWSLSEHAIDPTVRSPSHLRIGASSLSVEEDGTIEARIRDRTAPFGRESVGRVVVSPVRWTHATFELDRHGRHRWTPLALNARVQVDIEHPGPERWAGHAYVDTNHGDEPLEAGFRSWDWSRNSHGNRTHVVYDVVRRDGTKASIGRTFRSDGRHEPLGSVDKVPLRRTRWGVRRSLPVDKGAHASVLRTLEDTPFYTRTLAQTTLCGATAHVVHESVDLDRFSKPWVQFLIPFRMRVER